MDAKGQPRQRAQQGTVTKDNKGQFVSKETEGAKNRLTEMGLEKAINEYLPGQLLGKDDQWILEEVKKDQAFKRIKQARAENIKFNIRMVFQSQLNSHKQKTPSYALSTQLLQVSDTGAQRSARFSTSTPYYSTIYDRFYYSRR